jgi:hypothetical protein
MHGGKSSLGLRTLFYVLGRENHTTMWEREVATKGRKCMSGASPTRGFVQVFMHVRGFQWEYSPTMSELNQR